MSQLLWYYSTTSQTHGQTTLIAMAIRDFRRCRDDVVMTRCSDYTSRPTNNQPTRLTADAFVHIGPYSLQYLDLITSDGKFHEFHEIFLA